jgi:galactokinase
LTVGVALALIKRANLRERPEWQTHLRRVYDLGWYLGCLENGLDFPGLPGSAGVGTHGGSEDQTAILACKTEHVSLYRFVPVTPLAETRMPDDWTFVVASSGVQADKADSVKDRYNRAANGVRALHAIWNARSGQRTQSLCAALASHPQSADKLERWVDGDANFTADDLRQRLRHFIRENARPAKAAAAFRDADTTSLGELSAASQREAHELLGNQIPETMLLASLARDIGAFAASSFGAGFGGSVWAAVRAADAERFGAEWVRAYQQRMPHVGEVGWFVARPGPAATEIPL